MAKRSNPLRPSGPLAALIAFGVAATWFFGLYKFMEHRYAQRQPEYVSQPLNQ